MLDFKLAALLVKYNLPATFYIPKSNAERPVMGARQIKELSQQFEIGGHTLHHTRLHSGNKNKWAEEVSGSYNWLSDLLGSHPVSFCFPGGVHNKASLKLVFDTGYKVARTTELFSTAHSVKQQATPTTLQVYSHSGFTYTKHLAKRKKWVALFQWMKNRSVTDLLELTAFYLDKLESRGGCFHLWGHSWEIEECHLWLQLEEICKLIAGRPGFVYLQNKELIAQ